MKSRREFLKDMATGAALLETQAGLALGRPAAQPAGHKSRVVLVSDPQVHVPGPTPNAQRVAAMLDHAMQTYFRTHDPIAPWRHIVRPGQVVGLKINTLGHALSTHPELISAICTRLQQVGIRPGDIIVWDRTDREMLSAGYTLSTDPSRVRYCSTEAFGYEPTSATHGLSTTHFSKIMARCDVLLNVPILKNHNMAGITLAMKNMFGVIDNPMAHHGDGHCDPYIADLNMHAEIRGKFRFVIGDCLSSIYDHGPGFHPEYMWNEDSLIVGEDWVALDTIGWQIIEGKRAEMKLKTLTEAGIAPRYIATAADAAHRLGTNDPARIELIRTSLA